MKKPQSRCVECDERREGCHSVCEDYISFRKNWKSTTEWLMKTGENLGIFPGMRILKIV